MYKINNWFGRLGNNIQQLSNGIYYSQTKNNSFCFPSHPIIKKFEIIGSQNDNFESRFFFYNGPEKDFECDENELNKQRREICLNFVTPNLNLHFKKTLPEDTLVIHLRSGDVYISQPPSTYIPNPFYFYQQIMKEFQNVIVVTEDLRNPLIEKFKQISKVTIKSSNILDDFSTLLSAVNLASSGVGTFSVAAALCSPNLKRFYCSDIFCNEHLNPTMLYDTNIVVKMTEISNYIKIGEWKNSPEQVKLVLEYGF